MKFPQGEGSAVIHRKKNDLLHKDITYIYMSVSPTNSGKNSHVNGAGRKQAQDPPGSLHTRSFVIGGVKFPKGEGSAVIHRKKNDLLHKDTTYIYMSVSPTDSGKNSHVNGAGRKQAQDPPGSLHTIVSSVE